MIAVSIAIAGFLCFCGCMAIREAISQLAERLAKEIRSHE